jgi:hypothetical protein
MCETKIEKAGTQDIIPVDWDKDTKNGYQVMIRK